MLADVRQLGRETAKLAADSLSCLPDGEIPDLLLAVHRLEQAAAAMKVRVLQQAEKCGLPEARGHRTTERWLRSLLRIDPRPAKDLVEQAAALSRLPDVEQAVLDGRIDLAQAVVIAEAVDAVPDQLADLDQVGFAEARELAWRAQDRLIEKAERLAPFQLRAAAGRILAEVAPELAEQIDAAALKRQQERAHKKRGLTLSLPIDGVVRVSGRLDTEAAAIVQAALQPLSRPIPSDDRTSEQRRADALVEICRLVLRGVELPEDGGEPPQVSVTVPYDALARALGAGITDTGQPLSAETVRRMACDARITPFVLGGSGQILDLGRSRRLASGALRRALHVRDRGCAFPDCDRQPRWTDAHHITSWSAGGATDLDNLVLLCRHHHSLIHDPTSGWTVHMGPDRRPEFIPPAMVDPLQMPRRNLYHPAP